MICLPLPEGCFASLVLLFMHPQKRSVAAGCYVAESLVHTMHKSHSPASRLRLSTSVVRVACSVHHGVQEVGRSMPLSQNRLGGRLLTIGRTKANWRNVRRKFPGHPASFAKANRCIVWRKFLGRRLGDCAAQKRTGALRGASFLAAPSRELRNSTLACGGVKKRFWHK